jgi:hypothetical protein
MNIFMEADLLKGIFEPSLDAILPTMDLHAHRQHLPVLYSNI